ncbi:non-motile and phage-resistance protein [bacterium BMS3Abin04]|nr:non-motile and phage-resistance protein [bacterium BMS3Abin04]
MNKIILLVGIFENNELLQNLEELGFDVLPNIETGEDALKLAFQNKPDLAIVSNQLFGRLDNFVIADLLYDVYNIPVILQVDSFDEQFVKRAKVSLINEYLPTGCNLELLKFTITKTFLNHDKNKKLKDEVEVFKSIIDSSPEILFKLSKDFKIQFASRSVKNILGYNYNNLLNRSIFEFVDSEDQSKIIDLYTGQTRNAFSSVPVSLRIKNNENQFIHLSGTAKFSNLVGKQSDIILSLSKTGDKKLEFPSGESEKEYFTQILEYAPYGIAIISDQEFKFVNPEFTEITGYTLRDIKALDDWFKLAFRDDSYRKVVKEMWNTDFNLKRVVRTLSIQCKNGEVKQLDFRPNRIATNKLVISIIDVTEQRRNQEALNNYLEEIKESKSKIEKKNEELNNLNKALKESEQKLKELNEDKDKFFSILAHDLRTPFNALLGLSEFVIQEYNELSSDEVIKIVKDINSAGQNLFRLLENLLSWSRLTSGRADFNPEKVDLYGIALQAVLLLKQTAEKKEISLKNSIQKNSFVFVDETMIESVIENLITNAIKFTPRKGSIEISSKELTDAYQISISDTGVGISEENLQKLFRMDVHFTEYGTEREKGSGLGLLLCKEHVQKNGGKIWVESEEGKGSTFYFTVPKAQLSK